MAACEVEFCLLGPLEVRCAGTALPALPGKQRVLLAALLLKPNGMVSLDELTAATWAGDPPASAHGSIRNYVKELRKALAGCGDSRIKTVPGGYTIRVAPGELDMARFTSSYEGARTHCDAGAWREAAVVLRAGLSLWLGEPLSDVPSEWLTLREVPRLTEFRLQALELRCAADLQLGHHGEVVADLRQTIALHPLRERLHALLMLALYRNGQQAQALAAYKHVRAVLREELGAEPGPELRQLQQQILAADPALTEPRSLGSAQPAAQRVVPRELPAPVAHFTGRATELAELSHLAAGDGACALVICAVGGTAGVGKTALAVQWAHRVAGRFPDGQLCVDLRGYDPDEPVPVADALAGFLRALGVPGTDIPDGVEDRVRLYRSRLAGRRVLVLLDNARDGEQVRPLLPGDPGCVAVVTSRDQLAGLVAADGAQRLDLDVLPVPDAAGLLRSLIGPRADAEPGAVAELAGLCARLPLALRLAAEHAAARPETGLRDLAAELAAARLDLLDAGEDRADVRAVFSWSLRQLASEVASAFALIGLHPGGDLDAPAAAALTGTTSGQARWVLGRLRRASLLQASGPGRYGMHDLLRAYAREQAARGTVGHCDQALSRLFDYYLATAAAAMDVLFPAEADRRPRISSAAAVGGLAMPGQEAALGWLDRERANLVAVVVHCVGHGWPRHATDIAHTLFRYLMDASHLPEAGTIYSHGLQAARRSGDAAAEAEMLSGLGGIGIMTGHFRDAAEHNQAALERYRQCGDTVGQARALFNLAITESQLHNHDAAAAYQRQAIAAYQDAGDSLGVARTLANLAAAETELGSYDQAAEHLQGALPVLRDAQDQHGEARALEGLGELSLRRGQLTQATDFLEQALAIYRATGQVAGVATQLMLLGEVSLRQSNYRQAISHLRQALTLYRQVGYQHGEITTLRNLAAALHGDDQPAAARAELTTALRLAVETGNTYQQASAHRDLGDSHYRAGEEERARYHWQQALTLYGQLGAPEADQVRSRLDA